MISKVCSTVASTSASKNSAGSAVISFIMLVAFQELSETPGEAVALLHSNSRESKLQTVTLLQFNTRCRQTVAAVERHSDSKAETYAVSSPTSSSLE